MNFTVLLEKEAFVLNFKVGFYEDITWFSHCVRKMRRWWGSIAATAVIQRLCSVLIETVLRTFLWHRCIQRSLGKYRTRHENVISCFDCCSLRECDSLSLNPFMREVNIQNKRKKSDNFGLMLDWCLCRKIGVSGEKAGINFIIVQML